MLGLCLPFSTSLGIHSLVNHAGQSSLLCGALISVRLIMGYVIYAGFLICFIFRYATDIGTFGRLFSLSLLGIQMATIIVERYFHHYF